MDIQSLRARPARMAAWASRTQMPTHRLRPARSGAAGWTACLASLLLWLACPADALASTVDASAQRLRDGERVRILRAELARTVEQIAALESRSPPLGASGSHASALDAERHRAMADKAALEREIARTQSAAISPPSTSARSSGQPLPDAASQGSAREPNRWWDVYGKPPGVMTAAPTAPTNP